MDIEVLLTPVAPEAPCGEDLSFSPEFDRIADMRRADDPSLDQGEWVTALKVADWPGVAQTCETLLRERSKDLRLAMWLTEAWALTQGYAGLAGGLRLCTALCDRHWDALHPQPEDGDHEQRIGNLAWLLQRVVTLADTRAITLGRQNQGYSLRDLRLARQAVAQAERHPDDTVRASAASANLEQIQRALKETPAPYLRATLEALHDSVAALQDLQTVVDTQLGADGPGFVAARDALEQAAHDLQRLARDAGALASTPDHPTPAEPTPHTPNMAAHPAAAPAGAGPLRSRAQALQQLRDVAAFFRQTEPHSPVAYLADKAVKWGDMPLHEWLRHVVKDQGAMSHLSELLGLDPQADHAG